MNNIELKIILDSESKNSLPDVIQWIENKLSNPLSYNTFTANNTYRDDIKKFVAEKYDVSIRDGVTEGCYGARTGKGSEGLTLWMHASSYIDRYIDSEYGEQVNPWELLEENGTQVNDFESEEEIERFASHCEELGLKVKSDNTYNFATDFGSESSDYAGFMFDFQFDIIENEDNHEAPVYMAVMFHCGGDPRGNYTSKKIWRFDSMDDVHNVLFPCKILTSENE